MIKYAASFLIKDIKVIFSKLMKLVYNNINSKIINTAEVTPESNVVFVMFTIMIILIVEFAYLRV